MAEVKNMRLNKVLREFNISLDRAVEHLASQGIEIEARPTTKIDADVYKALADEFQTDKSKKVASKEVGKERRKEQEELREKREKEQEEKQKRQEVIKAKATLDGPKQVGKVDLSTPVDKAKKEDVKEAKVEKPVEKKEAPAAKEENSTPEVISNRPKVQETKVKGKIDLQPKKKPVNLQKRKSLQ